MKPLLMLDVSSVYTVRFYAVSKDNGDATQPSAAFAAFIYAMLELGERFGSQRLAFAFDSGGNVRKREFSGYKETRNDNPAPRKAMLKACLRMLKGDLHECGFKNLWELPGFEADDVIASVCACVPGEIVIVSGDGDLYQLLSDKVSFLSPRSNSHIVTPSSFREKWNFEACDWWKVKALAGCDTDDVPGVPGVGEKTAVKWFNGVLPEHHAIYQRIKRSQAVYKRNIPLVRLPHAGTPEVSWVADGPSREGLRSVFKRYGLGGLLDGDIGRRWKKLFVDGGMDEAQMAAQAMRKRMGGW